MTRHRFFPYTLIVSAGLIWGATFSLALIATAEGAHPLALSSWQVVLTATFFAIARLASRFRLFNIRNLRHYIILAVIGIAAPNLLYYFAAPHLSAGILSITVSTVPVFTYAIMLTMRFESIVIKRGFGLVLGMIAILLLVLPDHGLSSGDASFWILLVLVCALLYSIENVYISKGIDHNIDIRELLFASNVIAALAQFPLAMALGLGEPVSWLASDAGLAVLGIAIGSGFAYSMFFYTIKTSGPVFASQTAYIVTISGVIWGIIIFSEQHSLWVWASIVVMMLGLVLVTPDRRPDAETAPEASLTDSS